MEKKQDQTAGTQQTVECSKCHNQVLTADGVQKTNGFVCNKCISKQKTIRNVSIAAIVAIAAIIIWLLAGNRQKTGEGFDGVGEVQDSVSLTVNANEVNFALSTATAVSSPVSTQAPISNIEDFKNVFAKNVAEATENNSESVIIPNISILFKFESSKLSPTSIELLKEYASAYLQTNKEAMLLVEGFTCDLGGKFVNNWISEQRAKNAQQVLIEAGVPENKIEVKWYGKSRFNEFSYPSKSEYRQVILSIK